MLYICTQPRISYYAWHLEVMLTNFKQVGILDDKIHVLLSVSKDPNDRTNSSDTILMYNKLKEKFNTISFFEYIDSRVSPVYIPSVISNTVKQHYKANPWLEKEAVFLHDCDMIFTKPVDFSDLEQDNINYVSNSKGFIDSDYILHRGRDLFEDMCDIIGIDYETPVKYKEDSGGSQYIFKGTDYKFWHKVETDSENLYKYFQASEPKRLEKDPSYYGIQQFTAGMWGMLWNCWFYDLPVKITPRLDFCWGTDPIAKWDKCDIFHNAGVTQSIGANHNIFYKGAYTNALPYNDVLNTEYSNEFGSWHYTNLIRNVAKSSCLV
jgi:hypothetical protein